MSYCRVHQAIIDKGFRQVNNKGEYSVYQRGVLEIRYMDGGANEYSPHNPDSNRYVMQLFINMVKKRGGTAWYAILGAVDN